MKQLIVYYQNPLNFNSDILSLSMIYGDEELSMQILTGANHVEKTRFIYSFECFSFTFDINYTDDGKVTTLDYAAFQGKKDLEQLLMDKGATKTIYTKNENILVEGVSNLSLGTGGLPDALVTGFSAMNVNQQQQSHHSTHSF